MRTKTPRIGIEWQPLLQDIQGQNEVISMVTGSDKIIVNYLKILIGEPTHFRATSQLKLLTMSEETNQVARCALPWQPG